MGRGLFSLCVAVLLLGTMFWGQCAACPLRPQPADAHDCCKKAPKSKPGSCPHDEKALQSPEPVRPAMVLVSMAPMATQTVEQPAGPGPVHTLPPSLHGPPDLFLQHSVLLI